MSDEGDSPAARFDKAMFGLCELLGLTFSLPFGDDLWRDTEITFRHTVYLGVGVGFALFGPFAALVLRMISMRLYTSLRDAAYDARTWIALLLILFMSTNASAPIIVNSPPAALVAKLGVAPPTTTSASALYLRNISIGATGDPGKILVLVGYPTVTVDKLRIFVDYAEYEFCQIRSNSNQQPARVEIGELDNVVKGIAIEYTLLKLKKWDHGEGLTWGITDKGQLEEVHGETCSITRMRLVIVGQDNKEQHEYFMLVELPKSGDRFPFIVIPDQNWADSWERL